MQDVLISGKTSFKIEVPYKLIESGKKGKKPLIIYLHGYNQNIEKFKKLVEPMLNINAYHLLIQGPYPIYDNSREKDVSKWGRAWYLYDGKRGQFAKSLEVSSEFIQEIIDNLIDKIDIEKIALFGYSMGGYQAAHFALSRWKHISEAVVVGARIKTELFTDKLDYAKHISFLAIHGKLDKDVLADPQANEIKILQNNGLDATFKLLDKGHLLDEEFVSTAIVWLKEKGYQTS